MPLETDFNITPYFDDYSEDKNFHRVLFRPGVSVQARELTQLQSILQNQVERFGDNIYKTGTIIKGCALSTDTPDYIKIRDIQVNGQPVNVNLYSNSNIVSESSNLTAVVINSITGFESQSPDLNTLYIKYLNTGTGGEKLFANGSVVKSFNPDYTLERIIINSGGAGYQNSDTVYISGGGGTGAAAVITTDATGEIIDVSITSKGTGYITAPTIAVNTSTATSTASLTGENYIAELTVATSALSGNTRPTGKAFTINTSEGIIYQKGFFIRVDPQTTIVSRYTPRPDDVSVGFYTDETIINSNVDDSLLDNATGSPNFSAPGANRLKLTPVLTTLTTANAEANGEFLSLLEFQEGLVVRDRTSTQFNSINSELKKRTYEESGDYVLSTLSIGTQAISGNDTHVDVTVSPGTAYVQGERVQILNKTGIPTRKATDTKITANQNLGIQTGNYVVIKELYGVFDTKTGAQVNLRNTAATDVTDNIGSSPTSPGSTIGTAKIRGIEYKSGVPGTPTCEYRLYLFDIRMNKGSKFSQVRSVSSTDVIADVVLEGGIAQLQDVTLDRLVFNIGAEAVKTLTNETYSYKTFTNGTFDSTGSDTVDISSVTNGVFPYANGVLGDATKENIIIIPSDTFRHDANNSGTVSITSGQANLIGSTTSFIAEYDVGDYIVIANSTPAFSTPYRIASITNNTLMTLSANFTETISGGDHTTAYPAYVPIDFTKTNKDITISDPTTMVVSVGNNINLSSASFTAYHEITQEPAIAKAKTKLETIYVKISNTQFSTAAKRKGPWCLGIPDAYALDAVYVGTGSTYTTASTNRVRYFELNTGQKDNYYGLSYLKLKKRFNFTNNSNLLVKLKAFTHGTGTHISIDSYPVQVDNIANSTHVAIQDIPVYVSPVSGETYSLRNTIDLRPIVANTANLSTSVAGATIDPSTTETFAATEKYFPSTTVPFEADVEAYLRRIDRVVIDSEGAIRIKEGEPDFNPLPPIMEKNTMDLGLVYLAPYPTLTPPQASSARRPDLQNRVTFKQTPRYTMQDISSLESRIQRLEYYTLLNTLEQDTKNLTIPSESNTSIERFKMGFFVDAFNNYDISNINDSEYSALIDIEQSRLSPQKDAVPINLTFNSSNSSGVTKKGDLVMLNYSQTPLAYQMVANKERTLVESLYLYQGKMLVTPNFDNYFDDTKRGVSEVVIDIASPISSLVNALNDTAAIKNQKTSVAVRNSSVRQTGSTSVTNGFITTITNSFSQSTTRTTRTTSNKITVPPTVKSTQSVGEFLTDVQVSQFIRPQRIGLLVGGLRPGAQHYVFFDKVNITSSCIAAVVDDDDFDDVTVSKFRRLRSRNSANTGLYANATGELAVIVNLPSNTFTTGEREFLVMDFDSLNSETSATSKSTGRFTAFNLSGQSQEVRISTKTFDLSGQNTFKNRTFTDTKTSTSTRSWTTQQIIDNTPPPDPPVDFGGGGDGSGDPLAQTIYIDKQAGGEVVYITAVDVYFKQKDALKGVMCELRYVENGYPTSIVYPFGRKTLRSSQVSVSSTAALPTKFTFNTPVAVKPGTDIAIVLTPEGLSPNYRIWTCKNGLPDVGNPNVIPNKNFMSGTLFYSTSNRVFTAVQDEDIKFKIYRANFTSNSGTVVLNNDNSEFLLIDNATANFTGGEDVAQIRNSYITVGITGNTTSRVVNTASSLTSTFSVGTNMLVIFAANSTNGSTLSTATGNVQVSTTTVTNAAGATTAFDSDYSAGDFIKIGNDVRQVVNVASSSSMTIDAPLSATITNSAHYNNITPKFDIAAVTASNTTTVTLDRPLSFNTNTSTYTTSMQLALKGVVSYYSPDDNILRLSGSTAANTSFKFNTANSTYLGTIVGELTEARATVANVENVTYSSFTPLLNYNIAPSTSVTLNNQVQKNSTSANTARNYVLDQRNVLDINDSAVVKSRSNEITDGTGKSIKATLALSSRYRDTTPVIDVNPSSLIVEKFEINNDSSEENTRSGNATCKYISKRIELADGLDAEDVRVFLTAYKPSGSNIEVYAKVMGSADSEDFDDKDWSELQQLTAAGLFSSSKDENDVKEYEYGFKLTPASTRLSGRVASYSNTTIDGSGTNFTSDLSNTSLVKIVYSNSETDYDIIPVANVDSATTITLASNTSASGTGLTIEIVDLPKEAFKYNKNSNIVRYYDSNLANHDSYKYLAVKIVLRSNKEYLVPFVNDIRAMAVSI